MNIRAAYVRRKYYDLQLVDSFGARDYRMNGPALSPPSNSRKHWYIDGDRTLK